MTFIRSQRSLMRRPRKSWRGFFIFRSADPPSNGLCFESAPRRVSLLVGRGLGGRRRGRHRPPQIPDFPAHPAFDVTGGPGEVVLESHFRQAPIARPTQAMYPNQRALGSLNGVTAVENRKDWVEKSGRLIGYGRKVVLLHWSFG